MGADTDMTEGFGLPGDFVPPGALMASDLDDDDAMVQQINERRALAENADALRLARAL